MKMKNQRFLKATIKMRNHLCNVKYFFVISNLAWIAFIGGPGFLLFFPEIVVPRLKAHIKGGSGELIQSSSHHVTCILMVVSSI